jgi:hypothetical protein
MSKTLSPLHAMVLGMVMIDAEQARRETIEREDETLREFLDQKSESGEI